MNCSGFLQFSTPVNTTIAKVARVTGTISRNVEARRDVPYNGGVPQYQPRSQLDYWSGQLQLTWSLQ